MTDLQRRRSPRHPTDLPVQYRFLVGAPWRNCRIVDLSADGAAVELDDLEPGESFGNRIDLEISSVAPDAGGAVLRAAIRRRGRLEDNRLVVGVAFTPTAADCANLLRLLVDLHSVADGAPRSQVE